MKIMVDNVSYIPQRIFCIGRNYKAHVAELNNQLPAEPVVFMKPASSLVPADAVIPLPKHGNELHHETEVVVAIGKNGQAQTEKDALTFIAGISLGLDLTLRDVQNNLKKKGLPWEKAKAFDYSSPVGTFVHRDTITLTDLTFSCTVNGSERQKGSTSMMIFPITTLICALSSIWSLKEGDLIYTGTPEGVGPLKAGDHITVNNEIIGSFSWTIRD